MTNKIPSERIEKFVQSTINGTAELINSTDESAEKCAILMTVASTMHCVLSMHLGGSDRFNSVTKKMPGQDDTLLAALLVIQSCELTQAGSTLVDFCPLNIATALSNFRQLTGRDGIKLLDPHLQEAVKECTRIDPDGWGPDAGKFFPTRH